MNYGRSVFDDLFDMMRSFDRFFARTMQDLRGEWPADRPTLADENPEKSLVPQTARGGYLPWYPALTSGGFRPSVECFTEGGRMVLRAELPGIDPKDVDVSVIGDRLVLKGEKREQRESRERDFYFREVSSGSFERSFTLPEGAKTDKLEARFENGILEITLPVEGASIKARKIEIKSGKSVSSTRAA